MIVTFINNWFVPLLCIMGAINWGLVVFFKFNLVEWLDRITGGFGIDKVVYALIALSGIYALLLLVRISLRM